MNILIKFPTRGRKEKFFNVLDKYYSFAADENKISFQITLDNDDTQMNNDSVIEKLKNYKNLKFQYGISKNKIDAVNRDMVDYGWDIVLLASDDMIPIEKGYDQIIRENMKEHFPDTDGVLWFHDGNRKDLNTLCILGNKYYKRFNYIYNPNYKSQWCDNEFTDVANILNKQIFIDKTIIHHQHPDLGYGSRDRVHHLNAIDDSYDRHMYYQRKSKNFDI